MFFPGFLGFDRFAEFMRVWVDDFGFLAGSERVFEEVFHGGSALIEVRTCEDRMEVGLGEKGGGC